MARLRRHAMTCGADLGAVLGEGHIPHPVQAILDRPVPTQEVGEPGRAGLGEGEAGDRIDDHGPPVGCANSNMAPELLIRSTMAR
jgi:hypothetical protein